MEQQALLEELERLRLLNQKLIAQRDEENERAPFRAEQDPLTQLWLSKRAKKEIQERLDRLPEDCISSLIVLDIDHFCTVNVARGRMFGDTVLQRMGDLLRRIAQQGRLNGENGVAARMGGDEFLLFLPGVEREPCMGIIEKLRESIASSYIDDERRHLLCASIGLSICTERDAGILIDNAFAALCYAQQFNTGSFSVYEDLAGPVGFLGFHEMTRLHARDNWEDENIFSFAFRTLAQVTDLKASLHVLYSRIARQYEVDEVCVIELLSKTRSMRVQFLWNALQAFLTPSKPLLSGPEAVWVEKWVSTPLLLNDRKLNTFSDALKDFLHCHTLHSLLLCPIFIQGVFHGSVIYGAKKKRTWDVREQRELREVAAIHYGVIEKIGSEQLNRSQTTFISRISNELRAPLADIIGLTEILQGAADDDPLRTSISLRRIGQTAQDMLAFVDNVLEMSRLEHSGLGLANEPFSLRDLTTSLEMLMRGTAQGDQTFTCFSCCRHDMVRGDEAGLRLVLTNLLANAFKFTSSTGIIRLFIEETGPSGERNQYRFCVEDSGIGISPVNLERIRSRFRSEKNIADLRAGEGFGLALCNRLVTLMGGHLDMESREYEGSRFFFTLSLPESEYAKASLERSHNALTGLRILFAEDNEENAAAARRLLTMEGAVLDIVYNGRDLVQTFSSSAPGTYDLILTDMRMPYMTGMEAAVLIRSLQRPDSSLPIITTTSEVFDENGRDDLEKYFTLCLPKPVDIRRLIREIRQCLNLTPLPE